MEDHYAFCESERSRKLTFFRRVAMLVVFGLFAWQMSGVLVVSVSGGGGSEGGSCCCEKNDPCFTVRHFIQFFSAGNIAVFENALLFGQVPCR